MAWHKICGFISALVAGPIGIGMAYGVRALLTGGDAASETAERADRGCRNRAAARWHTQIFHHVLAKLSRVASKRL